MPAVEQGWCANCQQTTVLGTKKEGKYLVLTCKKCRCVLAKTLPKKIRGNKR